MMGLSATIRPDDWNLPLFVHVLGALFLVGFLVASSYYLFFARRDGSIESLSSATRVLTLGALPAYVVMRVGAQWIYSKEHLDDLDTDPAWVGIGFITSDLGLLLLVIASIVVGLAVRKARRNSNAERASRSLAIAGYLTGFLVVAYTIAVWAMAAKPD